MKKIKFSYKRLNYYLTMEQLENIIRRFNPYTERKKSGEVHWIKKIPCSLCESYKGCKGCTFRKFSPEDQSPCLILLRDFLGVKLFAFDCSTESIYWKKGDRDAIDQMRQVASALVKVKKGVKK